MIPSNSSESLNPKPHGSAPHSDAPGGRRPGFTAADYIVFLRCPRSAHLRLAAEPLAGPEAEPDLGWSFPFSTDRTDVFTLAREEREFPAGSQFSRILTYGPFEAIADVWHPQRPEGMAAVIVREASSLKQSYLFDSVFIRYCAMRSGEPLTRQFVFYLQKAYVHDGTKIDANAIFVCADVTRRVRIMYDEHERRLDLLGAELETDPRLERHRDTVCERPHSCPVCSPGLPQQAADHPSNLFRGGELARTLLEEGYTSIPDVPEERLANARQRIQRRALESGTPHVDTEALRTFLATIEYPVYYLDFEAVNSALPGYSGTRPWEHVPYLFSVHVELIPGAELRHESFLMNPHRDERRALVQALLAAVGQSGTVLVYGSAFETGVLRRLAEVFPEYAEGVFSLIQRVVDLLRPFSDFSYYHSTQRGKVSLKTVLPVLTDTDYSGLSVGDGYAANLAFRYLGTTGKPEDFEPLSVQTPSTDAAALANALVSYCTMDTLAMVRIMQQLRELAGAEPRGD